MLTLLSAFVLNLGYLLQHAVAAAAPPLSLSQPIAAVRSLAGSPRWLAGFAAEGVGWLLYVAALRLAPLSLVQATAAGGIGILAVMVSRITGLPLSSRERAGVALSVAGLALLGVSLLGSHAEGAGADYEWIAVWLGASAATAAGCVLLLRRPAGAAAAFGIASGILFAAGDVATKMAVSGGTVNVAFFAALIAFYAAGQALLQAGFQRGTALTTAGLSTLLTNALPIVAGMILFGEPVPNGWVGALRLVAFGAVIAGAGLLSSQTPGAKASRAGADTRPAAAGAGTAQPMER